MLLLLLSRLPEKILVWRRLRGIVLAQAMQSLFYLNKRHARKDTIVD